MEDFLLVKIIFGPSIGKGQLKKAYKFSKEFTINDALNRIIEKEELYNIAKDVGLFKMNLGWLDPNLTLVSYNIKSFDIVQFEHKIRKMPIRDVKTNKINVVEYDERLTIYRNLPLIANQLKKIDILPSSLYHRVAILNKENLLLNLDLPDQTEFLIIRNETFKLHLNLKGEDIGDNLFIYALLPYCEGEIFKQTRGIMKGWKRMYFSLRIEKIGFFKDQKDHIEDCPLFSLSIQDIKGIDKLGPKKTGFLICIRSIETDHYFFVEGKEQSDIWVDKIEKWLTFKNFFGPIRLNSRSRTLAHFALVAKETTVDKLSGKSVFIRMSEERISSDIEVLNDREIDRITDEELESMERNSKNGIFNYLVFEKEKKNTVKNFFDVNYSEDDYSTEGYKGLSEEEGVSEEESESEEIVDNFVPFKIPSPPEEKEIMPRRQISVLLNNGKKREMIVDEEFDIYELAYMISEEVGSEFVFTVHKKDFGENREVELLDHQLSLQAHNIPNSATFLIKKSGITDEYMGINDIYDNHFLYVMLPTFESEILFLNPLVDERKWSMCYVKYVSMDLVFFEKSNQKDPICTLPFFQIQKIVKNDSIQEFSIIKNNVILTSDENNFEICFKDEVCMNNFLDLSHWKNFSCQSLSKISMNTKCGDFIEDIEFFTNFFK